MSGQEEVGVVGEGAGEFGGDNSGTAAGQAGVGGEEKGGGGETPWETGSIQQGVRCHAGWNNCLINFYTRQV